MSSDANPRNPSVMDVPSGVSFEPRNTRERILFIALEIIADSGSAGFSLNEIARRGKFSKSSIFFHFRNLEEICLGCYALIRQFMRPSLQSTHCRDIRDFLERFGEESFSRTGNRHYFSMIYFFAELSMHNPKFRDAQRELTNDYLAMIADEFRRLAGRNVDDDRLIELVSYMAIVLDGIASHRIMFDDAARMKRIWGLVIDTISRELSAE